MKALDVHTPGLATTIGWKRKRPMIYSSSHPRRRFDYPIDEAEHVSPIAWCKEPQLPFRSPGGRNK